MSEPVITINGHTLSSAEAATLRVAMVSYALDLNENILGEDEHGKVMTRNYVDNLRSIQRKMIGFKPKLEPELEPNPDCPRCEGEGTVHDADFSNGDSDQQMFLMQDTMRPCPVCMVSRPDSVLGKKIGPDGRVLAGTY